MVPPALTLNRLKKIAARAGAFAAAFRCQQDGDSVRQRADERHRKDGNPTIRKSPMDIKMEDSSIHGW